MSKIRINLFQALLVSTMLLSSCVKDKLYNTPHPDKGAVLVTTDWTDALTETTIPESYLVEIDGKAVGASGRTCRYPGLFQPGVHALSVYHEPAGITLEGTKATVDLVGDGTIHPMPGYLFSAVQELHVVADDTLRVNVPMERQICPVILYLDTNEEDVALVEDFSISLSGVLRTVDLITGKAEGAAGTVCPGYTVEDPESGRREAGGKEIRIGMRLAGVSEAEKQMLTFTVRMKTGYEATFRQDLTTYLKDLNRTMEPVVLRSRLELPKDPGMSGGIEEWEQVDKGHIDVI